MNMKKIMASALAMSLSLVACGGGKTEAPAPEQSTPAPESSTPAAPEAGAPKNDTMKLVLSTNDGSTKDDRVPTPWLNRNMATNLMFRSLLLADSSLTKTSPDLAEKVEISEDGLTYTIMSMLMT